MKRQVTKWEKVFVKQFVKQLTMGLFVEYMKTHNNSKKRNNPINRCEQMLKKIRYINIQ